MDTIVFRCSSCNQALKIGADRAGRKLRCPKCAAVQLVPTADGGKLQDTAHAEAATEEHEPRGPGRVLRANGVREDAARPAEHRLRRRSPRPGQDSAQEADTQTAGPPDGPESSGPDADQEPHQHPRAARPRGSWSLVHTGLSVLLLAEAVGLIQTLGRAALGLLSAARTFGHVASLARVSSIVAGGLGVLQIAGYALCLFISPKHSARTLAVAALVILCCTTTFGFIVSWQVSSAYAAHLEPVRGPSATGAPAQATLNATLAALLQVSAWMPLAQLLTFATQLVIPFFLRAVARAVKADDTAESCLKLLMLGAGITVLGLLVQIILPLSFRSGQPQGFLVLFGPLSWILLLLGLAYAVWRLLILVELRRAVADRLGRARGRA